MNIIENLLDLFFSNIFGLLIGFGIISSIYRQLTKNRSTNGNSLLDTINRTIEGIDGGQRRRLNTEGALGSTNEVIQVGSTSINPNIPNEYRTFTERDMYVDKVEEVMTYSATEGEPYANPKELLDAGLLTMREYREMISRK